MTWRLARLVGLTGGASLLLLAMVVLGLASCRTTPSPPGAAAPVARAPVGGPGYVGAETCKGCHEDSYNEFGGTKMGRLFLKHPRNTAEKFACENCHGPGKEHAESGGGKNTGGMITFAKNDRTPVEQRNAMCLSCHTKGQHLFWQGSAHASRDVACTNCHTVMKDVSPRAQLARPTEIETCATCHIQARTQQMRTSHMPLLPGRFVQVGVDQSNRPKMSCSSCHNPHGTVTMSLLKENSVNETCYTCHAEKRGPFLWEHAPVTENCVNCHDSHGSNHERMLKVPKPRLCQQCHVETRHPTSPYGNDPGSAKFTMGRSCANCHTVIHGSNHPSGFAFTR